MFLVKSNRQFNIGFFILRRWISTAFQPKRDVNFWQGKTRQLGIHFYLNKNFSTSVVNMENLKVAIIGQSQFAAEVYRKIKENGHEVMNMMHQTGISPLTKLHVPLLFIIIRFSIQIN
jgi:hypothetical protein